MERKSDLDILTEELMIDPEFREEYAKLEPEMELKRVVMQARTSAGMTQAQLSEKSGISQADISRLEKGTRNPSLKLMQRLAEALDSTLKIEFIPNKKSM